MPKKPRSTRDKIRRIALEIPKSLDDCMNRLSRIDALCDGRSDYIDKNIPVIVVGLDTVKKAVDKWIEGL